MGLQARLDIVSGLRFVDGVFIEESLGLKQFYVDQARTEIWVMGDDWKGKFDFVSRSVV